MCVSIWLLISNKVVCNINKESGDLNMNVRAGSCFLISIRLLISIRVAPKKPESSSSPTLSNHGLPPPQSDILGSSCEFFLPKYSMKTKNEIQNKTNLE